MPRYVMAIDASKCLNCKACLIACQQRERRALRPLPQLGAGNARHGFALRWRYQPGALYALRRAVLR